MCACEVDIFPIFVSLLLICLRGAITQTIARCVTLLLMSVLTTRIWPPFIIITSKIPISYNTLSLLHISRLDKTFLKQNLQAVSVTSDHKIEFNFKNFPLHSQLNHYAGLEKVQRHFLPFTVSLWHRGCLWLPWTERILYIHIQS